MTKPLDPDIKALRAIDRALSALPDDQAVKRVLDWTVARATSNKITYLPFGGISWAASKEDKRGGE